MGVKNILQSILSMKTDGDISSEEVNQISKEPVVRVDSVVHPSPDINPVGQRLLVYFFNNNGQTPTDIVIDAWSDTGKYVNWRNYNNNVTISSYPSSWISVDDIIVLDTITGSVTKPDVNKQPELPKPIDIYSEENLKDTVAKWTEKFGKYDRKHAFGGNSVQWCGTLTGAPVSGVPHLLPENFMSVNKGELYDTADINMATNDFSKPEFSVPVEFIKKGSDSVQQPIFSKRPDWIEYPEVIHPIVDESIT